MKWLESCSTAHYPLPQEIKRVGDFTPCRGTNLCSLLHSKPTDSRTGHPHQSYGLKTTAPRRLLPNDCPRRVFEGEYPEATVPRSLSQGDESKVSSPNASGFAFREMSALLIRRVARLGSKLKHQVRQISHNAKASEGKNGMDARSNSLSANREDGKITQGKTRLRLVLWQGERRRVRVQLIIGRHSTEMQD